jgi:cytidine deaminase
MDVLQELFEVALAAQARAYAPYSHFRVGAALRAESGGVHAGCNVENAAYPLGACAEAGAISAMALAGDSRITDIVVVGEGPGILTPCGGCRQRLDEFSTVSTRVHCADRQGIKTSFLLSDLLPNAFGPRSLKET